MNPNQPNPINPATPPQQPISPISEPQQIVQNTEIPSPAAQINQTTPVQQPTDGIRFSEPVQPIASNTVQQLPTDIPAQEEAVPTVAPTIQFPTVENTQFSAETIPVHTQSKSKKILWLVGGLLVAAAITAAIIFIPPMMSNNESSNSNTSASDIDESASALGLKIREEKKYKVLIPESYTRIELGDSSISFVNKSVPDEKKQPSITVTIPVLGTTRYMNGSKTVAEREVLVENALDTFVQPTIAAGTLTNGKKEIVTHAVGPAVSYTANIVADGVSFGKAYILAIAADDGIYFISLAPRDDNNLTNVIDVIQESFVLNQAS